MPRRQPRTSLIVRPPPRRRRAVPDRVLVRDPWSLESLVAEIESHLAGFDLSRPDEQIYRVLDSWASDRDSTWCTEKESANLPVIREPSCNNGCNYCCYQHVAVSRIEADILAAHIRNKWSEIDIVALRDRLDRECERLVSIGVDSSEPEVRRLALSRLRRPCPMLDEESGQCRVYEARPVNCRRENSIDPEVCRRYRFDPEATESSIRLSRFDLIWGAVHLVLSRASTSSRDHETVFDATRFEPLELALTRTLGEPLPP